MQVAGTSGKIQTSGDADNDEGISTEMHGFAIIEALGMQRRNEVRQPLCWCSAATKLRKCRAWLPLLHIFAASPLRELCI